MKKNLMVKSLIIVLTVVVLLTSVSVVFAHPSSQDGILEKTYHKVTAGSYRDCIGGEDVGWSIDECNHTNETYVTYSFNSSMDDLDKVTVINSANLWNGVVTFQHVSQDGAGTVRKTDIAILGLPAMTANFNPDSNGHLNSWEIILNSTVVPQTATIAHEFGHIIGLNDLYESKNINKLMYQWDNRTSSLPSASDKWGARVIIGQHTSHTWSYKYHNTTSAGNNQHITSSCTSCGGIPVQKTISNCIYNA
ncbi:MAG: hypothetical protein IJB47_04700, partial [Oscillospiraceae bacterium]|nr:hypothetical protein [Oscillospiraceae bacterium]